MANKKAESGFLVMTVEEAGALLVAADAGVTADDIAADIAAGAPEVSPGKIDLFAYLAWLMKAE